MAYSRYHLLTQRVNKSLLLRTLERKGELNVYIREMCTCTETKAQVHTTETPSSTYVRGSVQSPFHILLHFNPYLTDEEAQTDKDTCLILHSLGINLAVLRKLNSDQETQPIT